MRRAIFLDRDGVVNRPVIRDGKTYPPQTLGDFEILPGVEEAVRALKQAGFLVIVVTNQPDVATGKQERTVVEAMHARLRRLIPVDDIRTCFHVDADDCRCRKPRPGMILDAARDFDVDTAASIMVGDRWRDIEAGQAAGCETIFIDHNLAERRPTDPGAVAASLAEAATLILSGAMARQPIPAP